MPIVFTFDIDGDALVGTQSLQNRVQCAFQRLGWQHLGGTAYRYPKLDVDLQKHPTEDWMNCVIPALMLFRTMALSSNAKVSNFTIDVQTSTGFDVASHIGTAPKVVTAGDLGSSNNPNMFGETNLVNWIAGIKSPY